MHKTRIYTPIILRAQTAQNSLIVYYISAKAKPNNKIKHKYHLIKKTRKKKSLKTKRVN